MSHIVICHDFDFYCRNCGSTNVCVQVCVSNTSVLSWEMLCLTSSVSSNRFALTWKGSKKHKHIFTGALTCELRLLNINHHYDLIWICSNEYECMNSTYYVIHSCTRSIPCWRLSSQKNDIRLKFEPKMALTFGPAIWSDLTWLDVEVKSRFIVLDAIDDPIWY